MTATAPIGVFDSGFGGLSVLRAIREALPGEDLLYCADHAWLPWGQREPEVVLQRCRALADALLAEGAKAIVVACNTATAAAAERLRGELDVPVVAMEPAVKPAAAATRGGILGVLGTGGTLASARFSALLERYGAGLEVITRPAPELVDAVESDDAGTRRLLVRRAVAPLVERGADVIVLGCTHFPFLRAEIEAAAGPDVAVIDTGAAVARELARRLEERGIAAPAGRRAGQRFRTTGDVRALQATLERLWGPATLEPLAAEPAGAARAQEVAAADPGRRRS